MSALTFLTVAAIAAPAQHPTVAQMQWQQRVLLVSVADDADAALATQRNEFAEIRSGRDGRDLVLVEVIGSEVRGSSDLASALRRTYRLPADRFAVVLIGKDGGEKRRSGTPLAAATLIGIIDAMPMRRAEHAVR